MAADILLEAELILMAAILVRKCKDCVFCLETPSGRHVCSLGPNDYIEPYGGKYIAEFADPSDECTYPESEDYILFMADKVLQRHHQIAASLPDRLKWLLPWGSL